jgi:hypothetical protein
MQDAHNNPNIYKPPRHVAISTQFFSPLRFSPLVKISTSNLFIPDLLFWQCRCYLGCRSTKGRLLFRNPCSTWQMLLFLAGIIPYTVAPPYYTHTVQITCSCPLKCRQPSQHEDTSGTKRFRHAAIDLNVRYGVFMAMAMNIFVIWDVTHCRNLLLPSSGQNTDGGYSETLVHIYQTTEHRISEASNLNRF